MEDIYHYYINLLKSSSDPDAKILYDEMIDADTREYLLSVCTKLLSDYGKSNKIVNHAIFDISLKFLFDINFRWLELKDNDKFISVEYDILCKCKWDFKV